MSKSTRSDALPLKRLLQTGGDDLPSVFRRAQRLAQITHVLRASLPGKLADHCLGVNVVRNTLVLFADSAPWATRLRYEQKAILAAISRETGLSFTRISLRVQPGAAARQPERLRPTRARLSSSSRHALESAARGVSDPELAAALRRLAKTAGENNP